MLLRVVRQLIIIATLFPALTCALSLQVNLEGINSKLGEAIRNDLTIEHATKEPKLTQARIQNLHELANRQIIATLQAKGYYESNITSSLIHQGEHWTATYKIVLGQPTEITQVSINIIGVGKDNPKIKPFLNTPLIKPGKIFEHADYEETKEKLLSDLNSIGYLNAGLVEHLVEVDQKNHSANIKITIDTGKQYVFGNVTFLESIYPDSLLVRYMPFKAGQPYDLEKLSEFQQNLESADLFSKIRFDPTVNLADENDTTVPMDVRLSAKPRNRYTGSVGYGTDTGFRGSLGWLHRRVDAPGHKVLANISASKIRKAGRVNYIIPGSRAATDFYTFGIVAQEDRFDSVYSRKAEIFGNKEIKRGKMTSIYGINSFTETFRLTPTSPKLNKKYLLPNVKWTWLNRLEKDENEYGTRFDLHIRGGLKKALSDHNLMQTELSGKHIHRLTDSMRLLLRGDVGVVSSKNFSLLPPSLRFFTGGDDTVRGYAYNSLSPQSIGGRYLVIGSAEIDQVLYQKLSGAIFYDTGNASMRFMGPLARAAGFGIRYQTPIGKLRVDLAKPFNLIQNKHWRVHLTFGTDF